MKYPLATGLIAVLAIGGTSIGSTYLATKQGWEQAASERGKKLKTKFDGTVETVVKPKHPRFAGLFNESADEQNRTDHGKKWTYDSSKGSLENACKQVHKETAWTIFSKINEDLKWDFLTYCCEEKVRLPLPSGGAKKVTD